MMEQLIQTGNVATEASTRGGSGECFDISHLKFLEGLQDDLLEIDERWKNVTAIEHLGWSEGYANGSFGIGILLDIGSYWDGPRHILAWFDAKRVPEENTARGQNIAGDWHDHNFINDNNGSVFAGVGNFVQGPNGAISSLCRVYLVEKKWRKGAKPCFFQSAFNGASKAISVVANREIGVIVSLAVPSIDGGNSMIQSVPEVSSYVSYDETGGKLLGCRSYKELVIGISEFRLYDAGADTRLSIVLEQSVKVVDVVRGPLNL